MLEEQRARADSTRSLLGIRARIRGGCQDVSKTTVFEDRTVFYGVLYRQFPVITGALSTRFLDADSGLGCRGDELHSKRLAADLLLVFCGRAVFSKLTNAPRNHT